jgi:6-pyruvoyltetrahydropterin/6-carboxytetrahydropterin synthase
VVSARALAGRAAATGYIQPRQRGAAPARRVRGSMGSSARQLHGIPDMDSSSYKVAVEKDYLVFAAGHFITYGEFCETLHGHNYRVRVELEGELDENAYVYNFVTLKRTMRDLVNELDHRMLLPLQNPRLTVREDAGEVEVLYVDGSRRYIFPRGDVVLLPIPNTTAEMLARHLTARLREQLALGDVANLTAVTVEVEEVVGQSAIYREEL